jgi:pantothenate kinase type III
VDGGFLIDCGNCRVKLARRGSTGPTAAESIAPGDFARRWRELAGVGAWVLPGAAASAATVLAAIGPAARVVGRDLALPDLGQYPGCGADRVVAGLAVVRGPGPGIVIDAGTATTLGAWGISAGRPAFRGGLILPGAAACLAGLAAAAPALPTVEPFTTRLAAAIGIGYPAMVRACLERLRRETGLGRVILTGGAWAPLREVDPLAVEDPDLVLRGLWLLTEDHR